MEWYVNLILGFLIGSWMATFVEPYRNGFRALLSFLAKKAQQKPKNKKKQ